MHRHGKILRGFENPGRGNRMLNLFFSVLFMLSFSSIRGNNFFTNSPSLGITATHPIYSTTCHNWRLAGELEVGERVLTYQGEATVSSTEKRAGSETVYNLEVMDLHNFLVGDEGVVVHNNYGILEAIVNAAKNVGKSFDVDLLNGKNFGKCKEKAKAIRKHLRDNGVKNPKSIRRQLVDNNGKPIKGVIGWDELDANGNLVKTHQVATEGFHEFTIINDKVFDNVNPNGIPLTDFLNRLHASYGLKFKDIDIFD